ncbi:MAG: nucleotidyltransferase family protein [Cyanobacteria bacterium P01_G01_bin.67]
MKVETKQQVIEIINNNLDRFTEFGVSSVGLFGSFVREEATPQSDVDLLVSLENHDWNNYCNLLDFLETLFARKVDLITETGITPSNGQEICREVEYVYDKTKRATQSYPD